MWVLRALALVAWLTLRAASALADRAALIVTLAGTRKLSEYFEWSCRSIGASSAFYDMLVFHEGNSRLQTMHCAKNVKFIDLGLNGLSRAIVDEVTRSSNASETSRVDLIALLSDVITHIPRYLVEPKPMFGAIFRDYLLKYTHWSYTDPDIVWGNLTAWIDPQDYAFDLITMAKSFDAGRLFVRGQFALHRNTGKMNSLWRKLDYFVLATFASRVATASRMLHERRQSEEIFSACFRSAEGIYSQVVFSSGASVKIIGRGVDDYSRDPVVVQGGMLYRCSRQEVPTCLPAMQAALPTNYSLLPSFKPIPASAIYDKNVCRMQWLPTAARYCIASQVYNPQGGQEYKLLHVGEAVLSLAGTGSGVGAGAQGRAGSLQGSARGGTRALILAGLMQSGAKKALLSWTMNDEAKSKRQSATAFAFFHFRHWDDYASTGLATSWGPMQGAAEGGAMGCMVLHLRPDGAMAFEACEIALRGITQSLQAGEKDKSLREREADRKMQEERRGM